MAFKAVSHFASLCRLRSSQETHLLTCMCGATCVCQGFPVRLAPGAPNGVRLLKGHPFTTAEGGESEEGQGQQVSLTQLAPEQQLVPAEIISGEQLPTFKVNAGTSLEGRAGGSAGHGQPLARVDKGSCCEPAGLD